MLGRLVQPAETQYFGVGSLLPEEPDELEESSLLNMFAITATATQIPAMVAHPLLLLSPRGCLDLFDVFIFFGGSWWNNSARLL
jgi:hypothetical protein